MTTKRITINCPNIHSLLNAIHWAHDHNTFFSAHSTPIGFAICIDVPDESQPYEYWANTARSWNHELGISTWEPEK